MAGRQDRQAGLQDVAHPDLGRHLGRDRAAAAELEPGLVLVQVVEQELGLPLERDQPGQALELAGMEPSAGDRHPESNRLAAGCRLEADLVDREAEIVEAAESGRGSHAGRRACSSGSKWSSSHSAV